RERTARGSLCARTPGAGPARDRGSERSARRLGAAGWTAGRGGGVHRRAVRASRGCGCVVRASPGWQAAVAAEAERHTSGGQAMSRDATAPTTGERQAARRTTPARASEPEAEQAFIGDREFQEAFGEDLARTLDVDTWTTGIDWEGAVARL